jgi:hypothetical protein
MKFETYVKRFMRELRRATGEPDLMRYDRTEINRHPSNRHRGAFKQGWGDFSKASRGRRGFYKSKTLRRLTWCDLGYRFAWWSKNKGLVSADPAKAFEFFKKHLHPKMEPTGQTRRQRVTKTNLPNEQTLRYPIVTKGQSRFASKTEAKLLRTYAKWLEQKHRNLEALKFNGLRCDAFEEKRGILIEAKASSRREDIRMAVGELLDYDYLARNKYPRLRKAILVPVKPAPGITQWLRKLGISVIWREKDEFRDNARASIV